MFGKNKKVVVLSKSDMVALSLAQRVINVIYQPELVEIIHLTIKGLNKTDRTVDVNIQLSALSQGVVSEIELEFSLTKGYEDGQWKTHWNFFFTFLREKRFKFWMDSELKSVYNFTDYHNHREFADKTTKDVLENVMKKLRSR